MTVVYLDRVFLLNSVVDYLLFLCAADAQDRHLLPGNAGLLLQSRRLLGAGV